MRTIAIGIVLVVLGFGLLFLVEGPSATREEFRKYLILVPAPAVLFLAGLFLYNLFRAPYLIYAEEFGKVQVQFIEADHARIQAEVREKELEKQLAAKAAVPEKIPKPQLVDKSGSVSGRVFYQDDAGDLNFPDPLYVKNVGNTLIQQVSVYLYFSEVVDLRVRRLWDSTGTGSDQFPFELWTQGNSRLSPEEKWLIPTIQGRRANINWAKPIIVKMEVFYGADKPEITIFRIEKQPRKE